MKLLKNISFLWFRQQTWFIDAGLIYQYYYFQIIIYGRSYQRCLQFVSEWELACEMRLTARAKEDLTDFFYFQDTGRNSCCKLEHNHDCGPENMKLLLRKTIKLDFLAYLYTIIECQEAKISNPAFQIRKNKGLPHKIVLYIKTTTTSWTLNLWLVSIFCSFSKCLFNLKKVLSI